MGKVHFYAIWSLREAPRQFIRSVDDRFLNRHERLFLIYVFGFSNPPHLEILTA